MRNDNKSWKKGPQRVGKQFGGPLGGVGGVGMPARPVVFKHGGKSSVKNNVYKKGGKVS